MSLREKDPMSLRRLLVFALNDLFTKRPASALMNSIGNGGPALHIVGRNIARWLVEEVTRPSSADDSRSIARDAAG